MSPPNSNSTNNNGSGSKPLYTSSIPLIVPRPSSTSSSTSPSPLLSTNTNSPVRSSTSSGNNNTIPVVGGVAGQQLSPTSAALSTAAAVAAMSSCFPTTTIPGTNSGTGASTNLGNSRNSNVPASNVNDGSKGNNKNDNVVDASSIMLTIPIIAPPVASTSASNTTTTGSQTASASTIHNHQGFNQGYGNHLQKNQNQQQQQNAATPYPQNPTHSASSRSNSNSSTPCPTPGPTTTTFLQPNSSKLFQHQSSTMSSLSSSSATPCPGPLAPPPSRLLSNPPQSSAPSTLISSSSSSTAPGTTTPATTSNLNTTNAMLPQNQLIYNHIPVPMPIQMAAPSPSPSTAMITANTNSSHSNSNISSTLTNNSTHTTNSSNSSSSNVNFQMSSSSSPPLALAPSANGAPNTAPAGLSSRHNNTLRHPGAIIPNTIPTASNKPISTSLYGQKLPQQNLRQQHSSIPTTTTSFRPRNAQIATPGIFANMALRRGKWTSEEERFANALIEEFEKGTILDCENGCTLRAYLSRKLHCAPMRISKKYAGKSIGKHVFLSRIPSIVNSRTGVGGTGGQQGNSNQSIRSTQNNLDRIRELEFHFHMSLLQEGAGCSLGQNIGKGLSSVVTGGRAPASTTNVMGAVQGRHGHASVLPRGGVGGAPVANGGLGVNGNNGSFPVIFPPPQSSVSNFCQNNSSATSSNSFMNIPSQNVNTAHNPSTTFQWFAPGPVNGSAPGPLPSSSVASAPSVSTTSTAMQMQETLFNAFKEAQTSSAASNNNAPSVSTAVQPSQFHITPSPSTNNTVIQALPDKGKNGKTQVNGNNSSNINNGSSLNNAFAIGGTLPAASQLYATTSFHNTDNGSKEVVDSGANGLGIHTSSNFNQSKEDDNDTSISTSQAQQNWLSETMHIIPTLDPSSYMGQFSPTYTSKSFDDLHQFIGKDCPPSTSATNPPTGTEIEGPATDAANKLEQSAIDMSSSTEIGKYSNGYISAADSYALFAQQSAMAVSKHSAYATPLPSNPSPIEMRSSGIVTTNTSTNTSVSNNSATYPASSPSTLQTISSKEQQVKISLPSSSYQRLNTGGEVHVNKTEQDKKDTTTSQTSRSSKIKLEDGDSATSITSAPAFSAANLQLHSAAVEEMEKRSDKSKNGNPEVGRTRTRTTVPENVSDSSSSASILQHTNIVSGSDRSGSDNGNGSGSSGSENASDNSDTASDEGQSSSAAGAGAKGTGDSGGNSKRRSSNLDGKQDAKRQKICKTKKTETAQ